MKSIMHNPTTARLTKAILVTVLVIAIGSFGYGWHRVVSAHDAADSPAADSAQAASNGPVIFQRGFNAAFDIPYNRNGQLYRIDPTTGNETLFGSGSQPNYSIDGTRVAFVNNVNLFLASSSDYSTAKGLVVSGGGSPLTGLYPKISPDNNVVAYQSFNGTPPYKVTVTSSACTSGNEHNHTICNSTRLDDSGATSNIHPAWSPTLTTAGANKIGRIVFVKTTGSEADIDAVNAVGDIYITTVTIAPTGVVTEGASTKLTTTADKYSFPTYSRDGTRIAFVKKEPSGSDSLYVMNANGSSPTAILSSNNEIITVRHPAWSPDGTRIAYSNGFQLLQISTDTFQSTELTVPANANGDLFPSWGPGAATGVANFTITKSADSEQTGQPLTGPITVGQTFRYNINITNNGPDTATSVVITDQMPSGVDFVSVAGPNCTYTIGNNTLICNPSSLSNGQGASVLIHVKASSSAAGIFHNQAFVQAAEHPTKVFSNVADVTVKLNNDNFANAYPISGDSGSSFSNNVGATRQTFSFPCFSSALAPVSPCEPNHAGQAGHQSVWWKWTASHTGYVHFDTSGSEFDTTLAAYLFISNKLTEVNSNDDSPPDQKSFIHFNAFAGQDYYIAVDGYGESAGNIFLNWSQERERVPGPAPINVNQIAPTFAKVKQITNGSFNVKITGSGFTSTAEVYVNSLQSDGLRPNRSVTPSEINVQLPASDLAQLSTLHLYVCSNSDNGKCGTYYSGPQNLDVIAYSVLTIAPGQVTQICALDTSTGKNKDNTCITTTANSCPGPNPCRVTTAVYDEVQAAELRASAAERVIHAFTPEQLAEINASFNMTGPTPPGSMLVASIGPSVPVVTGLNGGSLLGISNAPPLVDLNGNALISNINAFFSADVFAQSFNLIGHDGASLIGHDGASLIGAGGSIYNSSNGVFSKPAAIGFINGLIGHDGASLSSQQLAELIGHDGASLIGHDGASLIGHDGASLLTSDGAGLLAIKALIVSRDGAGLLTSDGAGLTSNLFGNFLNQSGANLVSNAGGTIVSSGGSGLFSNVLAPKASPSSQSIQTAVNAGSFDPGYKGWFVVSGSGGTAPTMTNTNDGSGNTTGSVSVTFNNTSSPKITDLSKTVLTVVVNPGIVQFSASSYNVSESAGSVQLTVTRSGDTSQPVQVKYVTSDGSALQRTDYTATDGTLNFAAGETSKIIIVPVVDDGYQEGSETFTVSLKNADFGVLGAQNTSLATITDNDGAALRSNPVAGDAATVATNPIDNAQFFTRQQYYDFLNRVPTQTELTSGAAPIVQCGTTEGCIRTQRNNVSNTFFTDPAFQQTGYFVYRIYKVLLGRQPTYAEFTLDRSALIGSADLEISKVNLVNEFMVRQILIDPQLGNLTPEQFVDRLNTNAGGVVSQTQRDSLVKAMKGQYASLASSLRQVADNQAFVNNESNAAFLLMLYFGYLRHDSDSLYAGRLQSLNQTGNLLSMIDAFVNSSEYRTRFGISAAVWEGVVLTASQTEIKTWTVGGRTYVYLKLSFPSAGYRVANWGQVSQTGPNFSADAVIETFSGPSVQAVTTTAGIYDLGTLSPGSYNFTFKNSGTLVKTVAFTVTAPPFPANPIDDARQFVKQQYRDFLNREADQAGEDFWTDNITRCADPARRPPGQTEAQCTTRQRETTSGAFFQSPEFQYTGYYVLRMYRGALGRQPKLSEFLPDAQFVGNGIVVSGQLSAAKINQNRADFAAQFVNCTDAAKYRCSEFKAIYDGLTNQQYVDKLFQTTGVNASPSDRAALVGGLNANPVTETRASVLQKIVDGTVVVGEGNQQFTTTYGQAFYNSEFNRAFVQLEYFGYMKRDPDEAGYAFWLNKLNSFGGDFVASEMVLAFISSPEYRARFGQP